MYNPYRPYGMVPKGTSVTVHLDRELPEAPAEMEKAQEVKEEKPRRRRGRPPKHRKPLRRRSQ